MTKKNLMQKIVNETVIEDLLDRVGIYGVLTMLAKAVRKQGKKRQKLSMIPSVSKQYVKLSEAIAQNIEKARDAI